MVKLTEKIIATFGHLTKKQQIIGRYICDHLSEVSLMNAPQIAAAIHVSESSLTRFVYAMGYKNFSDFHIDVRIEAQNTNANVPFRQIKYSDTGKPVYETIFTLEKQLLQETMLNIEPEMFSQCIDMIIDAEQIVIVGGPTQGHLAKYFADYLSLFRDRVFLVQKRDMQFYGNLAYWGSNSVGLVFSYPRYPKETIKITSIIAEQGVKIIAFTDSQLSPLVKYSEYTFITPLQFILFVEPASPATALIHSLLVGIYVRNKRKITERMKKYEELILSSDMFEFKDYNFTDKL